MAIPGGQNDLLCASPANVVVAVAVAVGVVVTEAELAVKSSVIV
jgi:hypothetical protein